jgi:hypothetical protein
MLLLAVASPALCEDLVGTVAEKDGQAVQGVRIIARSGDGQTREFAITDASGQYRIAGLNPGEYFVTLDPAGSGVQGQTVASYVSNAGLTVNWSVAPGSSPLASAQPGTQLIPAADIDSATTGLTAGESPPPGCKGKPGPPCGPKRSVRRHHDSD